MKRTSVEWLSKELESYGDTQICKIKWEDLDSLLIQSIAMEKEQIIEAWDNGFANGYDLGKHDDQPNPDDAEQYYYETFK